MNSYAKQERSSIRAILMNARRSFISVLGALSLVLLSSLSIYAQVSTAQISGILKDNAGAILPGVKITVVDKQTGKETIGTTNENGYYVVSNLQPGVYDVRIEVTGFKKYLDENITLSAGDRVNISPAMEVGAVTEVVSVTSTGGDNVETENATVGQLIDGKQIRDLALNGRNIMTLMMLIPGTAVTNDEVDRGSSSYGDIGRYAINGMRGTSTSVTVDGGANQDSGNIVSLTNNVSVDFVSEVKIATSAYSAEYGRYGGSHINLSIRRGGKNFHGSLHEFFRNDVLNARSYFAPAGMKEDLRMNNFGWTFGGPIYWPDKFNGDKKKLFFFAGQEYKRRIDGDTRRAKIPMRAFRNGDFSSVGTQLYYPTNFPATFTYKDSKGKAQPLAGKAISTTYGAPGKNILRPEYISENGKAMMRVYDEMEKLAVSYTDKNIANNVTFMENNRDIRRQDVIRLDYNLSSKNNFSVRYLYDTGSNFNPYESSSIPTRRATRRNQATNIQVTWNSTLDSKTINELSAVSNYLFLERYPDREYTDIERYGFNIKEGFGDEMQTLGMPSFSILGYTGVSAVPGGRGNPHSPVWDGSIRDNLSRLMGNHQLKLGTLIIRNRKNERASSNLPGSFYFSTARNVYTSNNAIVDALFGNFRDYTEGNYDKYSYIRFSQYDGYVADTWKVRPNLTLDLGLRYSYMGAPYDKNNTLATFAPDRFDFANAQEVIPYGPGVIGTINPKKPGKLYNGIVIGGDNFPNPGAAPSDPAGQNLFGGLPSSIMSSKNKFSPRIGFAWDPFKKGDFVIRGGGGIYYGRINLVSVTAGANPPFSSDVVVFNGNLNNLVVDASKLPVSITGIDPDVTFPSSYNWSFGFQKKLPYQTVLDINYVSTQGRHLLRRPDINKVTPWDYQKLIDTAWEEQKKTKPTLKRSDVDVDVSAIRPYEGFTSIPMYESTASSSYHGLQMGLTRRYAKNLSYSFSYTLSKVLTDASSHDSGAEDLTDYSRERSHASFDRNHILTASYNYLFPFYSDQKGFMGKLLGGWQLSGTIQRQSGAWLSTNFNQTTGRRRMDLISRPSYLDPREELDFGKDGPSNYWFNPTMGVLFAIPPDTRWGTAAPNSIKGPGYDNWNMSFFKTFKISEGTNLQFRAEAFNVWNHTNFRNPNIQQDSADFGTISDSSAPRLIQFALKFNF